MICGLATSLVRDMMLKTCTEARCSKYDHVLPVSVAKQPVPIGAVFMKVLLVEDELQLCEALRHLFRQAKFNIHILHDGEAGLNEILGTKYDVIILDLMLPKLDGLEILRLLRQRRIMTPVLILTAKGSASEKVIGLDCGADDYLSKPFDPNELLARVRALYRRKSNELNDVVLSYCGLKLNRSTFELIGKRGQVRLVLKEFEVIQYLMYYPNHVVSKDALINHVWAFDADREHNNIEVYISFLRKKLQFVGADVKITTVRGAGYRLEKSDV